MRGGEWMILNCLCGKPRISSAMVPCNLLSLSQVVFRKQMFKAKTSTDEQIVCSNRNRESLRIFLKYRWGLTLLMVIEINWSMDWIHYDLCQSSEISKIWRSRFGKCKPITMNISIKPPNIKQSSRPSILFDIQWYLLLKVLSGNITDSKTSK